MFSDVTKVIILNYSNYLKSGVRYQIFKNPQFWAKFILNYLVRVN